MKPRSNGVPSFSVERRPLVTIVHVTDEIDLFSARDFEDTLASAESGSEGRIVVSLETCRYCDSTCVSIVLRAWRRLGSRFFLVVRRDSNISRVFDITGIAGMNFVKPTLEDALSASLA